MRRRRTAWERAKAYGIDTTLLTANLSLSYTERLLGHMRALRMVRALVNAGQQYYARSRRPAKTTT